MTTAVATAEKPNGREKKRIALVFCGGTIAMAPNPKTGALEPAKTPEQLLARVPKVKEYVDLDIVEAFNKDSSNLRPEDWQKIVETVHSVYNQYDGIVVSHGTDTMPFSASAVAFAMQNLNKPIVFTGSQSIPDKLGSDAPFNLENAFRVATSEIAEVMITFGHTIHRGVRAIKVSESSFEAFESPITGPLGYIESEIRWHPSSSKKSFLVHHPSIFQPAFVSDILSVRSSPPMEPWMIEALIEKKKLRGLIFEALGAGNIATHYHEVIEKTVKEWNIPVLVTSPFIGGSTAGIRTYASGLGALKAGAISTGDMTVPAATVKLSWILGQIDAKLKEGLITEEQIIPEVARSLAHNYVGEITV